MLHELYIRWTMPTVALLASLVSACATLPGETPYPREIAGHILTVRENGKPQSIASLMRRENIPGGVNCEDADTQPSVLHAVEEPDDIDDDLSCVDLDPVAAIAAGLREHLQARPADTHVLLFVHGGLNNRRGSFQRAVELLRKSDGPSDSYYPIFVNWRSALLSSYWDHLSLVRQGEENRSAKFWSPCSWRQIWPGRSSVRRRAGSCKESTPTTANAKKNCSNNLSPAPAHNPW